jgi:lipopolysaccharide biosynthesis protein
MELNEQQKTRVIAFYLPQYHPIPENDKWWGKGFTEWTNVAKAKPLFKGHYQPRIPADLGFYDLRMPEVREAQAEMARESGISGFCYWHYWFGEGKKILERPFAEVLGSGKPDFPFCLGWANHSWKTSSWKAIKGINASSMLIEQKYDEQDFIDHFYYLLPAFKDKRYINIDGKPLFVIFLPLDIPNAKNFVQLWNSLALENNLKGIYFAGLDGSRSLNKYKDIVSEGFDAVITMNKNYAESKLDGINGLFKRAINKMNIFNIDIAVRNKYKYSDIVDNFFSEINNYDDVFPSIVPGWDRSPRAGKQAVIYTNSTPELFKKLLLKALDIVKNKKNDQNKIVFIQSWNEWAEGNYLEPDLKYGDSFLKVIKEVLADKVLL